MLLKSFIGNDNIVESLLGGITSGWLSHGLIISGYDGFGVNYFSKLLAADILNVSLEDIKAEKLDNLTIIKGEGASGQIKIDSIRKVNSSTSYSNIDNKKRVIIIENCENFNANSANALLKNLEEPASDIVYILTTTKPWLILATIRSRCSVYTLQCPSKQEALQYFKSQNLDMDVINSLSNIYQGNIGLIKNAYDSASRYDILQKAIAGYTYIQNGDNYSLSKLCFTFNKKKDDFLYFLQDLEFLAKNDINYKNINLLDTILKFRKILNYNVNLNLCLENFALSASK